MLAEQVDRRILCAVSFVDATTGRRVREPLRLSTPTDVRFVRNHSALYVFVAAPNLTTYEQMFQPTPPLPLAAVSTLNLSVADPSKNYLSRSFSIVVPRTADIGPPLPANSVFDPTLVRLFPSPAAATAPDWAAVRAHVTRGGADLAGALVRVIRQSDSVRIGTGLSDDRGEALVAVPAIPLVNWAQAAGPVLASQIDVTIETAFDPNAASPPNPDSLDQHPAASSVPAKLGAGDQLVIGLTVP